MFGHKFEKEKAKALDQSKVNFENYVKQFGEVEQEREKKSDEYNAWVVRIDSERGSLKTEINKMYRFLEPFGTMMDEKVSVFDFAAETPFPKHTSPKLDDTSKPDMKEEHYLTDALLRTLRNHSHNKKELQEFVKKYEENKIKYDEDIRKRKQESENIEVAIQLAEEYYKLLGIVKDTITDCIMPYFLYMQAFLYADAIKDRVIDGLGLDNVGPNNIAEYKDTIHNDNYVYMKNVFDYYNTIRGFYSTAHLKKIVEDSIVTEEEKRVFSSEMDELKNKSNDLGDSMGKVVGVYSD